jgi:hypothetical protein
LLFVIALVGLAVTRQMLADRQPFDPRAPLLLTDPFATYGPEAPNTGESTEQLAETNCRYGVAYIFGNSLDWVPTLDAGWYLNFTPYSTPIASAEFVPVLSVKQVIVNGVRQPAVRFNPPLTYTYRDEDGKVQPGLGKLISDNPGRLWLVGNEPDVDNPIQGNTMPDVYARAYHDAYQFIKRTDPTAKVAIAGLSMMTPGRVQYLDIVWNTYRATYGTDMPVDVWNMHLYILEERNPDNPNQYGDGKIALGTDPALAKLSSRGNAALCPAAGASDTNANDPRLDVYCRSEHDSVRIFKDQVYNMRNWMKAHGQQDKPLIISEFGLLYPYLDGQPDGSCEFLIDETGRCFSPPRVTEFLRSTIQWMESVTDPNLGYPQDGNRLVQQWLWYSIVTNPEWSGGSSNLIVNNYLDFAPGSPNALTEMGQAFRQEATSRPITANLTAGNSRNITTYTRFPTDVGVARLTATFRNSDLRSITGDFTVTFYSDEALTQPIGSVVVRPAQTGGIIGCTWGGRNSEQVSLLWEDLAVGTHPYWAKIDSGNQIDESNDGDNVTTRGTVTVYPSASFIPVVRNP